MTEQQCIIAYDHDDDLDECAVCGWPNNEITKVVTNEDVVKKINMLNWWMRENCHG